MKLVNPITPLIEEAQVIEKAGLVTDEVATQFMEKATDKIKEMYNVLDQAQQIIASVNAPKKKEDIYIKFEMWEAFKSWLVIDRKIRDNSNMEATKSRFRIMCRWFYNEPLNRETFNRFIDVLKNQEHYSNNYINNFIKVAKNLDRWLGIGELLDYTYFNKTPLQEVEVLSPEEIAALVQPRKNAQERIVTQKMYSAVIWFLATTGCRVNEALDLTWNKVFDYPPACEFVYTKNGENRRIPLSDTTYRVMQSLGTQHAPQNKTSKYVFTSIDGYRLNSESVGDEIKARAEIAGIKRNIYSHIFRHSYITELIKIGVPIAHIARLVGHKEIQTTMSYTHLALTELADMADQHPLLRENISLDKLMSKLQNFINQTVAKDKFITRLEGNSEAIQVTVLVNHNYKPILNELVTSIDSSRMKSLY